MYEGARRKGRNSMFTATKNSAALTRRDPNRLGIAPTKNLSSIIADNAAGHLMQRGKIDLVIVGSDRTLGRTGEVANKIGTYTKAVLAKRHNIPFYVAIPLSTIDWNLRSGFDIPIEERDESEVLGAWGTVPRSGTGGGSRVSAGRLTYEWPIRRAWP